MKLNYVIEFVADMNRAVRVLSRRARPLVEVRVARLE